MKIQTAKLSLIILLIVSNFVEAQYNEHQLGVSVGYNYTNTAKLFLFPNSLDPILRARHSKLNDIWHPSLEARYRISDFLAVGLNIEYLEKTNRNTNFVIVGPAGSILTKIEEGFSLIPVELSAYYFLPFSTDEFKFHMGGGAGIYFGRHIRKFGGVSSKTKRREFSYGIHVALGMDYLINSLVSVRGEMRFRDPEFELLSKYNKENVKINGALYKLSNDGFESKTNVDGSTFTLSIVFHLL
ncbi:MAG: outer membrane beta-barrel protein [Bacteroidetes bacterium]|nr:outer membrane beta-barrel protein [Bacteroidota bacterium]MBU1678868.1 outer membrane beta-barrel protein [Bacteroidota bacterium]MBU2505812.1 outer membrane beta-barrel protein [Bacteroidota bacterium]